MIDRVMGRKVVAVRLAHCGRFISRVGGHVHIDHPPIHTPFPTPNLPIHTNVNQNARHAPDEGIQDVGLASEVLGQLHQLLARGGRPVLWVVDVLTRGSRVYCVYTVLVWYLSGEGTAPQPSSGNQSYPHSKQSFSQTHHVHHGGAEAVDDGGDELAALNVRVIGPVGPVWPIVHLERGKGRFVERLESNGSIPHSSLFPVNPPGASHTTRKRVEKVEKKRTGRR